MNKKDFFNFSVALFKEIKRILMNYFIFFVFISKRPRFQTVMNNFKRRGPIDPMVLNEEVNLMVPAEG